MDPAIGEVVLGNLTLGDDLLEGLGRSLEVGCRLLKGELKVSPSSGETPLSSRAVLAKDSAVSASVCATPPSAVASAPSRMRLTSPSFRAISKSGSVLLTQRPLRSATTARASGRNIPHVP